MSAAVSIPDPLDEFSGEDELSDNEIWTPENGYDVDWDEINEYVRKKLPKIPAVRPSNFTEFAFKMPRADALGYESFDFGPRRHMRRPYDTPAKRVLLCTARQVEKSTLLGNIALCYACMVPAYKILYVSPSATQTKTFSVDRIKEPIETSAVLRAFTTTMLSQNVFEKQFVNRSKITLRYAFLNADRTRGIPAHGLLIDELQDVLADNIPVIEQCTSHASDHLKKFIYAGTPKGLDNTIEFYRSGTSKDGRSMSTMGEWVVPCDAHGGDTGRYWNILSEKNIGKKSLICEKCGKKIFAQGPGAQWARMSEEGIFESYRIPQLMVPWKPWDEILLDYGRYPRDRFYNEVLGISFDSGLRPLTTAQVKACCHPDSTMHPDMLRSYKQRSFNQNVFGGLDHGTGEHSYSVLTLGTYIEMKFRVFFIHRFIGDEMDPEPQLLKIIELMKKYNVRILGSDYGGGFDRNDRLIREFGPQRIQKYQYIARPKRKVEWDSKLGRWKVHRTEVMSDMFNAIKRRQVEFPRWEEFREPYGSDFTNIFSEYNETLKMTQYSHRPDKPDDSFHSFLYCFLASMIVHPRPDIIAPVRELPGQGPILNAWKGPVDQG